MTTAIIKGKRLTDKASSWPRLCWPSAQNLLAGMALTLLGVFGLIMCFHEVPRENHDFIVFILGALSGAITATGASKAYNALATTGTNTTVNRPGSSD